MVLPGSHVALHLFALDQGNDLDPKVLKKDVDLSLRRIVFWDQSIMRSEAFSIFGYRLIQQKHQIRVFKARTNKQAGVGRKKPLQ